MMNGHKPLRHNSFRQIAQLDPAFRETPRTVLKTVEVIPPWVRIPLPPLIGKPCYAGLSAACASIGSTAAAAPGARWGRDRGAGKSLEFCWGRIWGGAVAAM